MIASKILTSSAVTLPIVFGRFTSLHLPSFPFLTRLPEHPPPDDLASPSPATAGRHARRPRRGATAERVPKTSPRSIRIPPLLFRHHSFHRTWMTRPRKAAGFQLTGSEACSSRRRRCFAPMLFSRPGLAGWRIFPKRSVFVVTQHADDQSLRGPHCLEQVGQPCLSSCSPSWSNPMALTCRAAIVRDRMTSREDLMNAISLNSSASLRPHYRPRSPGFSWPRRHRHVFLLDASASSQSFPDSS